MSKTYRDCWQYFKKSSNKDSSMCLLCARTLSCKGSTTTGLHRHLEGVHGFKREESSDGPTVSGCGSNAGQVKRFKHDDDGQTVTRRGVETMSELVSRLAAVDGFSFSRIVKSEFIREGFISKGYSLPRNPADVMKLVLEFYKQKKQELMQKIMQLKFKELKFSISTDEWTGTNNRRYMDVRLHYNSNESDSLGLVSITESQAETVLYLVSGKLGLFGLSFERDIVSTISDGATTAFGRLSPANLQLCYNHGLHLAVLKVLYTEKKFSSNSDTAEELLSDIDEDIDDELMQIENDAELDSDVEKIDISSVCLQPSIERTITAIRNIVKAFKYSAVRRDVLEKYLELDGKKEIKLYLDCKTRWNTMEVMVEQFLQIKEPIKKALTYLNLDYMWNDCYIKVAEVLLASLKPVRITVENLSREDSTLLTAEGALKFLFKSLEKINSTLSSNLLTAVKDEISRRRDKTVVSLIRYLHNPDCVNRIETDCFFNLSTKVEIYKMANLLLGRLFEAQHSGHENDSDDNVEEITPDELTLQEQLRLSISESLKEFKAKPDTNQFQVLTKEFIFLESTGKRSENLQQLLDALFTIKPTSTRNECTFSVTSNFITKRRTVMSDSTLDVLCFLKSYFKSKK